MSFRQWVSTVRHKVGEMHSRSEIPYELLCDELRNQGVSPPEIRVIFGISDHTAPVRLGDVKLTWLDRHMETMPWGFSLKFDQHNEHARCRVDFDARIYDPPSVNAFIDRFVRFLDAASRHPDLTLSQLLVMSHTPGAPANDAAFFSPIVNVA